MDDNESDDIFKCESLEYFSQVTSNDISLDDDVSFKALLEQARRFY